MKSGGQPGGQPKFWRHGPQAPRRHATVDTGVPRGPFTGDDIVSSAAGDEHINNSDQTTDNDDDTVLLLHGGRGRHRRNAINDN